MTQGKDNLIFSAVPRFARFILDNHLEEYVYKEIMIARSMEIPLWKKYEDVSTEDLAKNSSAYYASFLEALATNSIRENLTLNIENYKQDLLNGVNRDLITPEDFLLTHAARKKALLTYVCNYTSEPEEILTIIDEIDVILCHYSVAATHAYVELITKVAEEEKSIKDKLFTTSPGFYYIYDLVHDKQLLISERLFDTLGYHRYEYAGNNQFFKQIMHPHDLENAISYFASLKTMKDNEVRFFEYRMRDSKGEYQWMRNYESVYKWNADNTPAQLLGVALDITRERFFTEEIRSKEEALSEAQSLAHMGAYTWDLKNNVLSNFSGSLNSLGINDGRSFAEVMEKVHPSDKGEVLQIFEKALEGKRDFECEYRCTINDRERILWSRGRVSMVDDLPRYFKATVMDVTDQHHMVRKLQRSEQLYKQAQALNKIGNWSWHLKTGRIQWSDELFNIFGLAPQSEKMDYERFLDFVTDTNKQSREELVNDLLLKPGHREFYFSIRSADGVAKVLYGQSETLLDDNGGLYKIIGTFQDVTAQKSLEKTLFDRTVQLQKSNASLKVFAYISSHDLKEPLRKISLFGDRLRMLNEKKMDEQSNNLLKTVIRSSLRLQQMIDEILSVSRINTDENFEDASLDEILREAISDLEPQIEEKSAIINYDELPVARVNRYQVRQLFVNLLSNALKFSRPGIVPVIMIQYDHPPLAEVNNAGLDNTRRYMRIRFTDNGIGFHNSYAEKIFAIFKRLHDKSAYKGTGIGLAVCREIAGHHQGHIMAEGTPGQGSTFTLILPFRIRIT